MRRLRVVVVSLSLCVFAAPLLAVSYVVPTDRFEIERSGAIIVGRVLGSHVESSPRYGIETVTDVDVQEVLKGEAGPVVRIHEPGGILGDEGLLIAGVPALAGGDRVLLLLHQRDNGDYTISDLQLGSFHFAKDTAGQELLLREEFELSGREAGGAPHVERHRLAEPFLDYVRTVVRGEAASENYVTATLPLAAGWGAVETHAAPRPATNAAFTATSYTLALSGGLGSRWNTSGNVNWNQGNSETGAIGSGTSQINAAFGAWDGAGAHYVLNSSSANPNGLAEASDGVNNIVFEKNLGSFGVQPYNCASGGVLGLGGNRAAFGGGAHTFQGETFGTITEGDVSLNQGLSGCSSAQVSNDTFNSLLTHEVGHSLDLRHSDQNRSSNAACSTDPSLDCSGQAIMNHLLISGLNAHLQAWDLTAFTAVYLGTPACTAPSIGQQPVSTSITSGNSATLVVAATGTATLTYQWYVGTTGNTSSPIGGGSGTSISVSPTVTTSYWVRVTGQCAPAADSATATVTVNPAVCTPPSISQHPGSTSIVSGNNAQLAVTATGSLPLTYQWFVGTSGNTSAPVGGGTGSSIFVNPTTTTSYWVRVTGQCAPAADSTTATVTVTQAACTPPFITQQPGGTTIVSGGNAQIVVVAGGTQPLTYQWFIGTTGDTSTPSVSGTSSSIFVSPFVTTSYWVRVSGQCGPVADSTTATVIVTQPNCPTVVPGTPQVTAVSGGFQLSINATGGQSFTVAWFQGDISGSGPQVGTGNPFVVNPTQTTSYWARVTNNCANSADSFVVLVTVTAVCVAPQVTTQPHDQQAAAGATVSLTVGVSGTAPTVNWFQGPKGNTSTPVGSGPTITSPRLTQPTTQFWARITNTCGTVDSNAATIAATVARRRIAIH
jgi:hypothetical protein